MSVQPISQKSDRSIRIWASVATVIVALAAAALSWAGLTELALASGISPNIAFLLPIVIDGSMLSGSLTILHYSLRGDSGTKFPWAVVLGGAALSVWGNVAASTVAGPTAAIVHGAPPVALLASLELMFKLIRHRLSAQQAAAAKAEKIAQEAERAAAREAARLAAPATGAPSPPRGTRTVRARATEADGDSGVVEEIRSVVEAMPEGMTPMNIVIEILRAVPHATRGDINSAEVFADAAPSALRNAYSRAQKRISEESAESSAPTHVLHAV